MSEGNKALIREFSLPCCPAIGDKPMQRSN
jgi:hypothetical protein